MSQEDKKIIYYFATPGSDGYTHHVSLLFPCVLNNGHPSYIYRDTDMATIPAVAADFHPLIKDILAIDGVENVWLCNKVMHVDKIAGSDWIKNGIFEKVSDAVRKHNPGIKLRAWKGRDFPNKETCV